MEINGIIINPQSGKAGTHEISVSIASVNEGIDKEVLIDGVCGDATARLTIVREGMREEMKTSDGSVFKAADGVFGVLKGENPYVELDYIESTGTQYIDTQYIPNTKTSMG